MQTSRGARLTALALTTGTLVVAATSGPAGAAPVSVPDVFGGKATGRAIHLEVNLPTSINLPGLGLVSGFQQDISFTEGNTAKGVAPRPTSVAKAVLGNGNIVVVSDLLAKTAIASLDGQHTASNSLSGDVNLGPITASIGKLSSSVAPESATTTLTSNSSSSLAELSVSLGNLVDDLGLTDEIESYTDSLETIVDDTVNPVINTLLGEITEELNDASPAVADQLEAVQDTAKNLLNSLTATIDGLTADTDLVRLSLLNSTSNVTRSGEWVTATATSTVGGLNILGGLVTVDAAETTSTSKTNGRRGGASAKSSTNVAEVKVGDVLELALGTSGLTGKLLGQEIPQTVKDAFQTVLSTINGVLATAGVQIIDGKSTHSTDPNGQFASSSSDGLLIVVNPPVLQMNKPLVKVQLVPAGTAVNAARFSRQAPPRRPTGTVRTPEGKTPLAHTGAELPLLAILGTGLAAVALVRRRRSFEV